MDNCVHHWKQFGAMTDPFYCLKCGDVRMMETSFHSIMDKRAAGHFNNSPLPETPEPVDDFERVAVEI